METQLRPMSLGEILDRTAQLYRSNFLLFAGIAAAYAGLLLVLGLAHIGLEELFRMLHWTQRVLWLTIGIALLQWAVIFLLGGIAVAAMSRAVAWVYLGQRATIRGAYAGVLPWFGRLLWLKTIMLFVLWTPLAVCYGGFLAAFLKWGRPLSKASMQAGGHVDPGAAMLFGLLSLVFLAVAFAAAIYAVLMWLRYALAVPACVVEEIKARPALKRSIGLSKGSRGRIFVLGLLVAVIEIALVGLTQAFFIALAFKNHHLLPVWARVVQQIVGFATSSFLFPIFATGLTLFYYDQRVRKEGFDIEWMMQAAGLATTTAPVEAAMPAESELTQAGRAEPQVEEEQR
jgi:hypothetical protein